MSMTLLVGCSKSTGAIEGIYKSSENTYEIFFLQLKNSGQGLMADIYFRADGKTKYVVQQRPVTVLEDNKIVISTDSSYRTAEIQGDNLYFVSDESDKVVSRSAAWIKVKNKPAS